MQKTDSTAPIVKAANNSSKDRLELLCFSKFLQEMDRKALLITLMQVIVAEPKDGH